MELTIKFKNGKHIFFENGLPNGYYAKIVYFKKELYNPKNKKISHSELYIDFFTLNIKKIFKWRYEIDFIEDKKIATAISNKCFFADYYTLDYDNNEYKIIHHKRYKTSIYKKNIQIAYYEIKPFRKPIGERTVCIAKVNDNIDKPFIFSLIIAHMTDERGISFKITTEKLKETQAFNFNWKTNNSADSK